MTRTRFARSLSILTMVVIHAALASTARADIRRYLPSTLADGDTWGNFFTNFDRDVVDATKSINAGQIRFDYNTYSGPATPPNPPTYGGAALAGGFFMNPGVTVKPGFTLSWMQLITRETTFGIQGQNPPYPDTPTNPTNPNYPYQSLPVAANPAPNPAFQDFPLRNWVDGTQEWQAELALTCTANTPNAAGVREVRVAGSFFWGFGFNTTANPNRLVDRREPGLWGTGASQDFFNSFNARFRDFVGPPAPGQDRWDFVDSSNCFALVPEPTTAGMMVFGMVLLLKRNRAA